jgi:Mg-chelatase subunit ChlD
MLTGLSFLFLVGIGGAAYDLGKQQLVQQRMQQAADAAALSAAALPTNTDEGRRRQVANAFFSLNFPDGYLGTTRPTPTITITNATVTVTADAGVRTSFVSNFNIPSIAANAKSVVQIKQNFNQIDLVLVMDNSGSMAAQDVGATQVLDGDLPSMLAACIRIWSDPVQIATFAYDYSPYCVYPYAYDYLDWGFVGPNRLNALRFTADAAASLLLNAAGSNHRVAVVTWVNILIGFSDFSTDYASVRSELMRMIAAGGTNSTTGLQKALDLSANFRTNAVHAIILLTDGENNNPATDTPASLAACNALKAQPRTIIYTIAFGTVVNDAPVRQFLSDCATGPNGSAEPKPNENLYFYRAPDAAELSKVFQQIIGSLQRVRIIE